MEMLKPWRLLRCWNSLSKDALGLHANTPRSGLSAGRQNYSSKLHASDTVTAGKVVNKVNASYCIFKGKAALSIRPVLPTFTELNSGNFVIERRGVMLLTFFPAIGEHKYDYEKRKHFALSITEIGSLLSLGPSDSSEFFHDPSMLSTNAGQVRKSLSVKPYSGGNGSGYHVSLIRSAPHHGLGSIDDGSGGGDDVFPADDAEQQGGKCIQSAALILRMG